MKNPPKISVLMGVRNGEPYLRDAVDSIQRQTFDDFEFIIVEDASSDRSWEVLRAYSSRDPRMLILRNAEPGGLTKALNKCLAHARGEYCARMDADDISMPERFGAQVEFLKQNRGVTVLGTAAQYFDQTGPLQRFIRHPTTSDRIKHGLLTYTAIVHPSAMMRRKAVLEAGGYREAFLYAQDYDLWLRLAETSELANLDAVLLQYREHPAQLTHARACCQILSALGARFSAEVRRSTGWDPVSNLKRVEHESLLEIGVHPEVIERSG